MNDFSNRRDGELAATATTAAAKIALDPSLGVPKAVSDALKASGEGLTRLVHDSKDKHDLARAATIAKDAGRGVAVDALNAAGAILYANAAVTDAQLRALGFSPRPARTTRPQAPLPVPSLVATPFANGTVRLAWRRGGNRASALFLIEASADGQAWQTIWSTRVTKQTLSGFTPGVATWFRITATNALGSAMPSPAAAVYATSLPALRVAA